MKKKALSLALALALCLGLTIPAFAAETYTENWNDVGYDITCSARVEGTTVYISYTGSGELDSGTYDMGMMVFDTAASQSATVPFEELKVFSISIGQGLTVLDEFKEAWNDFANSYGFSVSFNDSPTPPQPEQPQQPAAETIAAPTNDKLEVNGTAADPTVYKINGSNYFKIRDVAALLNGTEKQFAVGYDGGKNAVTATTGQGYAKQAGDLAGAPSGGTQSAEASNDAIYVNGEKITAEVYKIGGSNYFKLRDLGKALNFYVGWSADRGMYIETDKPYSE